jgi:hypothetical protein
MCSRNVQSSLVLVVNARGEGEGGNDIRVIVRLLIKAGVLRTVRLASYPIPYCAPLGVSICHESCNKILGAPL